MNIRNLYLNLNSLKSVYSETVTRYAGLDLESEKIAAKFTSELNQIKDAAQDTIENAQHEIFKIKVKTPSKEDSNLLYVLSNNPGLKAEDIITAILYQTTNYTMRKTLLAIAEDRNFDVSAIGESVIDSIIAVLATVGAFFENLSIESAIENGASPEALSEIESLKDIWFID